MNLLVLEEKDSAVSYKDDNSEVYFYLSKVFVGQCLRLIESRCPSTSTSYIA